MNDDAFYATIAQVLPTLAIALSIETLLFAERRRKDVQRLYIRAFDLIATRSAMPTSDTRAAYTLQEACRDYNLHRAVYRDRSGFA